MPVRRALPAVLAGLLLLVPGYARATMAGTIFSGATTGDGAALYWNPAAMTMLSGTQLQIATTLSALRLAYERDTVSPHDGQPFAPAEVTVPGPKLTFGLVTDATLERWRFGLGLAFPMVDGASWQQTYGGRPSSTRYYAMSGRQLMFLISGGAAYRFTRWLSVGLGVELVGAWLMQDVMTDFAAKLNQITCASLGGINCRVNAPLSREDPAFDGATRIEGVGVGLGFSAGVLLRPTRWLRLGAGVHSGAGDVKVPVEISVRIPPAAAGYVRDTFPTISLPDLRATGNVDFATPVIVTAGIAVQPTRRLELAADLHWMDTSSTSEMLANITRTNSGLVSDQVLVKRREDRGLYVLRATYRVLEQLWAAMRMEYENNSRPDSFTTPVTIDFHKISLHAGAAWRVTPWLALQFEYAHFFLLDRRIQQSSFQPNAFPTTPEEEGLDKPSATGIYRGEADLFGLGVLLSF